MDLTERRPSRARSSHGTGWAHLFLTKPRSRLTCLGSPCRVQFPDSGLKPQFLCHHHAVSRNRTEARYSLTQNSIYSFSLFLPTIISNLGYSSVKAQLFTVPPNMAGFFGVLIGTFMSDKIKGRGPIMICGCSISIIGYILLLVPARPLVHYGGTFFVAAGKIIYPQSHRVPTAYGQPGIFTCSPAVMGWYVIQKDVANAELTYYEARQQPSSTLY